VRCMICDSDKQVRSVDLYVIGSEGLDICHTCEMILIGFIRSLMQVSSVAKKNMIMRRKERALI